MLLNKMIEKVIFDIKCQWAVGARDFNWPWRSMNNWLLYFDSGSSSSSLYLIRRVMNENK